MSRHETWRTREYFESIGQGIPIEEFLAVKRGKNQGQRLIDGLIVLNPNSQNPNDIEGRDVIAIQTKANRLGMYLLGQAFFTRELLKQLKPRSIKTVAICGKPDEILEPIATEFEIEVIVIPEK